MSRNDDRSPANSFDPYNADRPLMMKCGCGRDHTAAEHQAELLADLATD